MAASSVMSQIRAVGACDSFGSLIELGFREAVELALWERRVGSETRDAFRDLDYSGFVDFRVDGDEAGILTTAEAFLAGRNWSPLVVERIMMDIRAILCASSGHAAEYTLRLEYVTDDACRKFHKDKTDIRLITTYLGRGTQWFDEQQGNGEPAIQEMSTFEVGMFLGKRCGKAGHVFHRSPPIEGTGSARFVMVFDIERPGIC
ncbi:hypothetical protein HAD_00945 [Hyphomonas adhaerens MHS-3]|uniref:DUF1826 domain-containing protein n=1 Tax=Hyphomonas adhaerens MHS-3 TaxID=1280949 RepID=A0A069E2W3_9PROT|nr:DUF1826 domain-containing protein [Hyphomonas adhaerens]KCZ84202.1 hypothetical protein HAD_00945 [Hyphomonas adhaerens MHS-3]